MTGRRDTDRGGVRIAYLDGIRAVAIMAVIAVHWLYPYTGIARGGYIGVDIFFVLSGYIITRVIWKGRETFTVSAFLVQRVRRLYPALVGVVVLAGIAAVLIGVLSTGQAAFAGVLALTQVNSVVVGLGLVSRGPFNITWSLSAEWIFYILWPLVLMRLARRSSLEAAVWAFSVGLVLYLVSLPTSGIWFYYGPTSRAAQLLVGAGLALLLESWQPSARFRALLRIAIPVVLIATAVWIFVGPVEYDPLYRWLGYPLATVAAATLIMTGRIAPRQMCARLLSARPLVALGLASYSVYLWHTIPLTLLDKDLIHLPTVVLAALGVGIAGGASVLSYLFLERRFMRSRTKQTGVPAAPGGA